MKKFLFGIAILLLGAPAWGQVSTRGEGIVYGVPDLATITLSVVTENTKAVDALGGNSTSVSKLLSTVNGFGVDKKDVRTVSFNISPKYIYPKEQEAQLVGYVVSSELAITVRQTDVACKLLDALVKDGANQIRNVTYGFSDPKAMLDQAREAAVKDAKRRAEILVKAAGSSLGTLTSVTENANLAIPQSYLADRREVPLEAGQQALRVTVTTVWSVRSGN